MGWWVPCQSVQRGSAVLGSTPPLPTPTFSPTAEIYSCGISSHWTSECPQHAAYKYRGKERERDLWQLFGAIAWNRTQRKPDIWFVSGSWNMFYLRSKNTKRPFAREKTSLKELLNVCVHSAERKAQRSGQWSVSQLRSSTSWPRKSCPLSLSAHWRHQQSRAWQSESHSVSNKSGTHCYFLLSFTDSLYGQRWHKLVSHSMNEMIRVFCGAF